MSPREVRVSGHDALLLATQLLQRARLADPRAGVWEAADLQWWSRRPRDSDDVEQLFWVDEDGPVAGVWLTSEDGVWQCDPILVPGRSVHPAAVWARALEQVRDLSLEVFEVPVTDTDTVLARLARDAGLVPAEHDATTWMDAAARPGVEAPCDGFVLVDRSQRAGTPHPMRARNGDAVEERLGRCPLYDPELDLAVETEDGDVAAYSLYWFDPVTGVGLVEPVRVEDAHQRRGLARAMLTAGIDRLVRRGATRIKVSYGSEGAGALYRGVGFRPTSTATWYRGGRDDR